MSESAPVNAAFVPGDLLYGARRIADWLGIEEREARHQIEQKRLPTFTLGKMICSRKSTLAKHLADLERNAAASLDEQMPVVTTVAEASVAAE